MLWYSSSMDHPIASPTAAIITRAVHHDKVLAYGRGLSFAEYVKRSDRFGQLMRTRYEETRLGPALQLAAACFPDIVNILAIVSDEDPDTLAVLPIVARLVDAGPRCTLRILGEDDDLALLNTLAPDPDLLSQLNDWDLPRFLCFDEDWYLQAQWGPRPNAADVQVERWLAAHSEYEALADDESPAGQEQYAALVEELVYEMRVWYNSGLAQSCLGEWLDLLQTWQASDEVPVEGGR